MAGGAIHDSPLDESAVVGSQGDNRIVKVTSPLDHDVTRGNLSVKGRFGWAYVHATGAGASADSVNSPSDPTTTNHSPDGGPVLTPSPPTCPAGRPRRSPTPGYHAPMRVMDPVGGTRALRHPR